MKINYTRIGTGLFVLFTLASILSYVKIRHAHAEFAGCAYNTTTGVKIDHRGAVCYTNPATFTPPHLWTGPDATFHPKESVLGCGWTSEHDADDYDILAGGMLGISLLLVVVVCIGSYIVATSEQVNTYLNNIYILGFIALVGMTGLIVWAGAYDLMIVYCVDEDGDALDHADRKYNRDMTVSVWSMLSPMVLFGMMRVFAFSTGETVEFIADMSTMKYLPSGKYGIKMLALFSVVLLIDGIAMAHAGNTLYDMSKDAHHLDSTLEEKTLAGFGYSYIAISMAIMLYMICVILMKSADDTMRTWEMWVYGGMFSVIIPLYITITLIWTQVSILSAGSMANAADVESTTHDFAAAHTDYATQGKHNASAAFDLMVVGLVNTLILFGFVFSFMYSDYMSVSMSGKSV